MESFWTIVINVLIGENGTGKTMLLKALYSAVCSMEEYRQDGDLRSMNELLAKKLIGTFQVDKLGNLVNKSSADPLSLSLQLETGGIAGSSQEIQKAK